MTNQADFVESEGHHCGEQSQPNEMYALYEHAPGFVAASEGPNHVFSFANAAYRRLVGRTELVGKPVAEALPEIADQGFLNKLDTAFKTGKPFHGTNLPIRLNVPDSASTIIRYITFVYQPVRDSHDKVTGLFCEGFEVTAEREAAEKLAALQAEMIFVARVNAMGTMAATLAHELNQPLAAVSQYVAGCQRLVDPDSKNAVKLRAGLQAAEEASQRAGAVIRHIRDLTRRGRPTPTRFAAKAAIEECVRLVRAGACQDVDLRYVPAVDVAMIGDRVQVQQVIINLLRNACDAVASVSEKQVTIAVAARDGAAIVSVTDSGVGISDEIAKSVFTWTESTKAGGMGLGLSISRTIIEAHGGRIWLERSDEAGSVFCFSLPTDAGSRIGNVQGALSD